MRPKWTTGLFGLRHFSFSTGRDSLVLSSPEYRPCVAYDGPWCVLRYENSSCIFGHFLSISSRNSEILLSPIICFFSIAAIAESSAGGGLFNEPVRSNLPSAVLPRSYC